ncbi:MAG: class I SAM-dependent methyltransferase [Bdellovibrionales bacterium]|nr:class I SAM-dependent methyltransferase [Bdellovibrionales bacterium]
MSDNSHVSGYVNYVSDRKNIERTSRLRVRWLKKISGGNLGRVLDVGCATGFTVKHLLDLGLDAYGIEPSDFAANYAIKSLGLTGRILHGHLRSDTYPDETFDTIIAWDVIEHIPQPNEFLRLLRRLLRPGGTLSLITPDCSSLLAKLMGKRWMEYAKPTEHIFFFSKKTLTGLLKRNGFHAAGATTAGKHAGLDFLANRISSVIPLQLPFRRLSGLDFSVYIDIGDKIHLAAKKAI